MRASLGRLHSPVGRVIDLHTHILPGFDDGVRSIDEARQLAVQASAEGVTAVAATPHVRDDYPTAPAAMERGVGALRADFAAERIAIEVVAGGEVSLGRLWELPPEDVVRFTYGGAGRYLLLEFPYAGWPRLLEPTLGELARAGIRALLAHPERNDAVQAAPERLAPLVDAGALVQVTAGSLAGHLGRPSRETTLRLLDLGLVHVLASDVHSAGQTERAGLAAGAAALEDARLAERLTADTPAAILAGLDV